MKPDYLKNFFDWNRAVDFWKGLGKDKQIGLVSALIALIMILLPSGNSLKRKGYDIDLPRGAGKIKYKAVSEEHLAQLNDRNLQFVSQPVNVTTRKGDSHVQLEKMARVSFPIPKNIPKKERINLIGVLLTDDGPVYMIPDYMELQKGIATFETSHFCVAGLTAFEQDQRRELFIERTAASGWKMNACDKDLEGTLKEQLLDAAKSVGIDGTDLLGITLKEVFSDNDFVKKGIELIDTYDSSNGNPDKMAEKVYEEMVAMAKAKALSMLFEKLKGDKEVDVVDKDLKKEGKYKHTRIQMDGANKPIVEFLEGHMGRDNMEKIGKRLGNGENAYIVAYEFYREIRDDRLKSFAKAMVPQIKVLQSGARVMKVLKEFWSTNEMIDMYNVYARNAGPDGRMSDDDWNVLMIRRLNAAKAKFGLTEAEIRKQFEERYSNNREIERKKDELRRMIKLWEDPRYELTSARIFDKKGFDYIQRLTRVHQLMERFRSELVVKGELPGKSAGKTVDETLCEIVEKYLDLYPDQQAFYKWLARQGYMGYKLKRDADKLDEQRSWRLVRVETSSTESGKDGEHSNQYSASPGNHRYVTSWTGQAFESDFGEPVWYRPHTSTFTATVQAPPAQLQAGDSLVLHATLNLDAIENGWYIMGGSSLMFEKEEVGMGFISYAAIRAEVVNLNGSTSVGTRYGSAHSGDWDYVLPIPKGHKDELKAINFDACGSRTHWVYKWCSIFEAGEN